MKYWQLELTQEGEDKLTELLDEYDESFGKRSPLLNALLAVGERQIGRIRVDYAGYPPQKRPIVNLEVLIRRGYARTITTQERYARIQRDLARADPRLAYCLRTYKQISTEEPIKESDLNLALNILKSKLKGQKTGKPERFAKVINQINSASTKSEKVIALDSAIALVHDQGVGVLATRKDYPRGFIRLSDDVGKYLTALAEE